MAGSRLYSPGASALALEQALFALSPFERQSMARIDPELMALLGPELTAPELLYRALVATRSVRGQRRWRKRNKA